MHPGQKGLNGSGMDLFQAPRSYFRFRACRALVLARAHTRVRPASHYFQMTIQGYENLYITQKN